MISRLKQTQNELVDLMS